MENTQNSGNQPIPPVAPASRTPEDYKQQWRNHRKCRMAVGIIIAIIVVCIIFLAGMVVGRASARFGGRSMMYHSGYSQMHGGMRGGWSASGTGMHTMHGTTGQPVGTSGNGTTSKVSPAVPITPIMPAPTTTPANQ